MIEAKEVKAAAVKKKSNLNRFILRGIFTSQSNPYYIHHPFYLFLLLFAITNTLIIMKIEKRIKNFLLETPQFSLLLIYFVLLLLILVLFSTTHHLRQLVINA